MAETRPQRGRQESDHKDRCPLGETEFFSQWEIVKGFQSREKYGLICVQNITLSTEKNEIADTISET